MQLEQQAQEDLYARVATYLRQGFGELAQASDDSPLFSIWLGNVGIRVAVEAVGEDRAVVDVATWLGRGVSVTEEVAHHLLRKNTELRFGTLGVDEDGDITFDYSLLGESVTKDALSRVVRIFSATADQLDNELMMRFK